MAMFLRSPKLPFFSSRIYTVITIYENLNLRALMIKEKKIKQIIIDKEKAKTIFLLNLVAG